MSTNDPQFNHYHAMVSPLAKAGLAQAMPPSGSPQPGLSLALAVPAARLLLNDDAALHEPLALAMATLADMGRPWLNVGINIGTLAQLVDGYGSKEGRTANAAPARLFETMRQHARGEASTPTTGAASRTASDAAPGIAPIFPIPLTDFEGQVRQVHHPLAVHLCLAAFHRRYETIAPSLWSRCEQALLEMVAPLRFVEFFTDAAPPPALVPLVLWQALGLAEQAAMLSRDIDLEMIDSAVAAIVASPGREGALHEMEADDTIETWTYRELVGLHALARLALLRRSGAWARRVEQIAAHHLENTQPDHATSQPWAVFAFLWSVKTRSFAEQQLHDAMAYGGGVMQPLSAMLLADAADCLAEFL